MGRKSLLILLLLVCLPAAGSVDAREMRAGLRAGPSLAMITNDYAGDTAYRTGVAFGGFLSFPAGPTLEFQPEVLYLQQGGQDQLISTDEDGNFGPERDIVFKLHYVQIPILARVNPPTISSFKPSFVFGPAVAIKLSSDVVRDEDGIEIAEELDFIKKSDLALVFGLGFEWPAGRQTFTLDVRYNWGLTNINRTGAGTGTNPVEPAVIKNRSFTFLAGVKF